MKKFNADRKKFEIKFYIILIINKIKSDNMIGEYKSLTEAVSSLCQH